MDIGPRGIGHDYQREDRERPRRKSGDFQRFFEQFQPGEVEEDAARRPPARPPAERSGDEVEISSGQTLSLERIIAIFQERMLHELIEFVAERTDQPFDIPPAHRDADPDQLNLEHACEHVARCGYRAFGLTRGTEADEQLAAGIFRALDDGLEQVRSILTGLGILTDGVWHVIERADGRTRELLQSLPR